MKVQYVCNNLSQNFSFQCSCGMPCIFPHVLLLAIYLPMHRSCLWLTECTKHLDQFIWCGCFQSWIFAYSSRVQVVSLRRPTAELPRVSNKVLQNSRFPHHHHRGGALSAPPGWSTITTNGVRAPSPPPGYGTITTVGVVRALRWIPAQVAKSTKGALTACRSRIAEGFLLLFLGVTRVSQGCQWCVSLGCH
jgi:hypothetical protein